MSHEEMSLLKEEAPRNMRLMSTTADVSHEEMSLSKEEAPRNMWSMSRTDDVSHDPMSGLHVRLPVVEPPPLLAHHESAQNSMFMSVMRLTSQSEMLPYSALWGEAGAPGGTVRRAAVRNPLSGNAKRGSGSLVSISTDFPNEYG